MKAKGRYIRHQVSRLPCCLCHRCLPTVVAVLRIIGNPHLSFSDLCRSSSLSMKPITQSSFMASRKQKPEKQCHISAACAPHVAETSGENSKRRFMFLTRSSLFCYTRHSDSFSICQSANLGVRSPNNVPRAFTRLLLFSCASRVLHALLAQWKRLSLQMKAKEDNCFVKRHGLHRSKIGKARLIWEQA